MKCSHVLPITRITELLPWNLISSQPIEQRPLRLNNHPFSRSPVKTAFAVRLQNNRCRRIFKSDWQAYRAALLAEVLSSSLINLGLSAIRKLAGETADARLLDVQSAAAITRVKSVKKEGVRAGNWLTRPQAQALLSLPGRKSNRGKRDRVILALFVGAGLRRDDLVTLEIEKIQQREGRWCVVDLVGKGNRVRTVPIPGWAKVAIDEWLAVVGFTNGALLGRINKEDKINGQGLSAQAVYDVVFRYQEKLKLLFAPRDLRRYTECRTMPNRRNQ